MLIPKAMWNGFVQVFYWPKMFSCWLGALANMSWYCCVILSEFSLPSFLKETILLKCCSRFTFIKSKILVFYYDFFFFLKKKDIYIPYKEIRKKKSKRKLNTCLDQRQLLAILPSPFHHYLRRSKHFSSFCDKFLLDKWNGQPDFCTAHFNARCQFASMA